MPKKSTGEITVFLQLGDLGEDIEAVLEYTYIPGSVSNQYYQPNDNSEIEVLSVRLFGKDFDFFQLNEDAQDRIYQQIEDKENG